MNNYFTKEYIKECDCREIQGLRKDYWIYGDYVSINYFAPFLVISETNNERAIKGKELWLPLSHQLDEEIKKIGIEKIKNKEWTSAYFMKDESIGSPLSTYWIEYYSKSQSAPKRINCGSDINPLIAKIKLLKQLLKE